MGFYSASVKNNMGTISRQLDIVNKLGLHARAAAKFVNVASAYSSHVEIEKNGHRVNGKSIMGVMMLAAGKGSTIIIHVEGDDAETCAEKLDELITNRFDENE